MRAYQELGRQVSHRARAECRIGRGGTDPALQHAITHRISQCHVVVVTGRKRRKFALQVVKIVEKRPFQRVLRHRNAIDFGHQRYRRCYRHGGTHAASLRQSPHGTPARGAPAGPSGELLRALWSNGSMKIRGLTALWLTLGALAGGAVPGVSLAAASVVFRHHMDRTATDQVIVRWRESGVAAVQIPTIEERTARLQAVTGADVQPVHNLYGKIDVLRLERPYTPAAMAPLLAQIRSDPGVEYAEPDGWRFIEQATMDTLPNDPHFSAGSDANGVWEGQWYLLPSSSTTPS